MLLTWRHKISKMNIEKIYTVGHSNQSFDEFMQLITPYKIDCIIDVRSIPYSKYTPQFNSEQIKAQLNKHGILYAHFGKEFGARRTDCLTNVEIKKKGNIEIKSQVNFEMGIFTENFLYGTERLKKALSQGRNISLMCSEANPLECHRFSFLSRYFHEKGYDIRHIIRNEISGEACLKSHEELEIEMIMGYVASKKLPELPGQGQQMLIMDFGDGYDMAQQRIDAYRLKNREIGWTTSENNNEFETSFY